MKAGVQLESTAVSIVLSVTGEGFPDAIYVALQNSLALGLSPSIRTYHLAESRSVTIGYRLEAPSDGSKVVLPQ